MKTPDDETPFPDHVPPVGEKPVRLKADALAQVDMSPPADTVG